MTASTRWRSCSIATCTAPAAGCPSTPGRSAARPGGQLILNRTAMRDFGPCLGAAWCPYSALVTASRECQLADGRVVVLRRAGPGDVPAITGLYLELSPESFYRRFNTEQPAPPLVTRLASFGSGTACLVAATPSEPGRVVAEARCVPIAPGTAELALTVADSYQGAGLGHILLDALVARAREEGLERLHAVVLLTNTPMLRLLQRYGWVLAAPTEDFSVAFLEISAAGGMPGWPAGSAGLPAGHLRALPARRGSGPDREPAPRRRAGLHRSAGSPPAALAAPGCPVTVPRRPANGPVRMPAGAASPFAQSARTGAGRESAAHRKRLT